MHTSRARAYDAHVGTDTFPAAAVEWLAPARVGETLAVGVASGSTARRLVGAGQTITVVDHDVPALVRQRRMSRWRRAIAARPDALPFTTGTFETIVVANNMDALTAKLAPRELARVLVRGGRLAVQATSRDDSVPWVRRLAAIMRRVDPAAMTSRADTAALAGLADSPFFMNVEHREFRMWVPMSKDGLLNQVAQNEKVSTLTSAEVADVLDEISQLYDSSARAPEPLLLPYTVACWRAEANYISLSPTPTTSHGFTISF